jgi:chaperone modulatory protein CbpM
MGNDHFIVGVLLDENTRISIKEVCTQYHISSDLLSEMMEYGLFSASNNDLAHSSFSQSDLRRLQSAFRLHKDLGINLSGVALALDLLDKIELLEKELDILRKHSQL